MRKLRREVERALSNYRAITRLMDSERFLAIWYQYPELHEELKSLAREGNKRGLLLVIKRHAQLPEMTYTQLQSAAQREGIPNWSRLSVFELIEELEKRERKEKANAVDGRVPDQSRDCEDTQNVQGPGE